MAAAEPGKSEVANMMWVLVDQCAAKVGELRDHGIDVDFDYSFDDRKPS